MSRVSMSRAAPWLGVSLTSLRILVGILGAGLAVFPAAVIAAESAPDLLGTWHVLVHYKDTASPDPEAERWEDRVWVFAHKGTRLQWTEYPILVFRDESGRFSNLGTNRQRRILHYWEPNDAQRAQIREGLAYNTRGSKTKSLRGSPERGYRSGGAMWTQSASVVGYHETWSIEAVRDQPVFTREDVLGAARAETMEGRTRYETREVADGGRVLSGAYERDGTRLGVFRMTRAGSVGSVGTVVPQRERLRHHFFGDFGAVLQAAGAESAEDGSIDSPDLEPSARLAMRAEISRAIEQDLREHGEAPDDYRAEIEILTLKIERMILEDGRSIDEIHEMLRSGELQP